MPRLLLLRHAKAVAHSPDGDFARELSSRGRKDAARLGAWLRAQNIIPDAALVSPAQRTQETAQILFQTLAAAPAQSFDEALYNASAETLKAAIARASGDCLIVIAHNPGIAELAHRLAGKDASARLAEGFPTCALALFEASGPAARPFSGPFHLLDCVTPDSLR